MKFKSQMNDFLDSKIRNHENRINHVELVNLMRKSFYFKFHCGEDEILKSASLPLTEIFVNLFETALEELECTNRKNGKHKFNLKYATRLSRKSFISPYCFILALIYVKRLKKINSIYCKSRSVCDLFLISLIVSSKFLYDESTDEEIFNVEWATISGIDIKKLNQMEFEFLFKLNWQLFVGRIEFMKELNKIENLVIQNECRKRSYRYITYHEIMRIFENDKVYQCLVSSFLKFISKFILIASFSYSSVIIVFFSLSKFAILQSHLIQHHDLINQGYFPNHKYDLILNPSFNHSENHININLNNELNEKLFSRALNLAKLNNLYSHSLNNKLNILRQLEDNVVNLKDLAINIYNIRKADDDLNCKFNDFYKNNANQTSAVKIKNHNGYYSKK